MAFWLVISGQTGKPIKKGREKTKIYVGKRAEPIAIITRDEIQGYLTKEFHEMYLVWTRYNSGLGLPKGGSWNDYPEKFITILELFVNEWKVASEK